MSEGVIMHGPVVEDGGKNAQHRLAEMLNQLSLGLMHGALVMRNAGKRHAYHPGHMIDVEIRAGEDAGKGSMHIELRWRVPLSVTTAP